MKAIKITQEHKDNNPDFFDNYQVGQIAQISQINMPNKFTRTVDGKQVTILGYNFNEDQQFQDGFKTVVRPQITAVQKYGKLVEMDKHFVYEVLEKTEAELEAHIPFQIPTLAFQLALLDLGITEKNVIDTIVFAHENGLLSDDAKQSEIIKERLILKWTRSNVIERNNPELFQLIPVLNQVAGTEITEDDIKQIFVNYDA